MCSKAASLHMFCSSLEYCVPVWMPSSESHLCLLDSIVRSVEWLCEGELSCLGHRKKASALCLLNKIHHRVDHHMNEYLNYFVASRNTRASAALGELAIVIPHGAKLINSVGRFCLLLRLCETCCHWACLVVALWALLRTLWTCTYWELSLILFLYFSHFAALGL